MTGPASRRHPFRRRAHRGILPRVDLNRTTIMESICAGARRLADVEAELDAAIRDRREPLLRRLDAASRGRPWTYVLFGSLARGDARRHSDADILIRLAAPLDAAGRRQAWRAAEDACLDLGLRPDIWFEDEVKRAILEAAIREGVAA